MRGDNRLIVDFKTVRTINWLSKPPKNIHAYKNKPGYFSSPLPNTPAPAVRKCNPAHYYYSMIFLKRISPKIIHILTKSIDLTGTFYP